MSLGIAFKGPEGIVLAADSRVTLSAEVADPDGQQRLLPSSYDNGTKLLKVENQDFVGVVTYGVGAIGQTEPRTAQSFIPEFEAQLKEDDVGRLPVRAFADRLGNFFQDRWDSHMPDNYDGPDMTFVVGGYDEGDAYGRLFEVAIPGAPSPTEWHDGDGDFGPVWGGQKQPTDRLIQGFDDRVLDVVRQTFGLQDQQTEALRQNLKANLTARIPYQFLPLQDCVNLAIFLIRTTAELQDFQVAVRGVGGAIDVATITRTEGYQPVQEKEITGEES